MRGVVYFLHGQKHAIPLVVSLYSLRKHYQGDVALITTELTTLPAFGISIDPMLRVTRTMQIPLMTAEGGNYAKGQGDFNRPMITKAALHRHTPYDLTLHLDADTLILADPAVLFALTDMSSRPTVLPTRAQMNPERVINMEQFCQTAKVEWKHRNSLPVNTGVMVYWRHAPLMEAALQLAIRGATAHRIADELAMQALYPDYPHVLVTDRCNWSPLYGEDPDPVIMHSPGCRMTLGKMRQPWLAHFKEVWENDVASVRQWGGEEAKLWLSQLPP